MVLISEENKYNSIVAESVSVKMPDGSRVRYNEGRRLQIIRIQKDHSHMHTYSINEGTPFKAGPSFMERYFNGTGWK